MNYTEIKDFLNKKIIDPKSELFVAKTKKSYLIGPKIDQNLDIESFYRRIISNSIYSTKIYKKTNKKKICKLITHYKVLLNSNEVIEIFANNKQIIHKIGVLPKDKYEKK